MSHEKEFDILELIRRCVEAEGVDAAAAQRIEQAIQNEAAGLWTRIPKKKAHLTPEQRKQVYQEGLANVPTVEITSKYRIDRATLYRLMKRGR